MARTAESILLGSTREEEKKAVEVNLKKLAPAVGCSSAALCRWRKYGFPDNVKVFARLCRERGLTAEQIGNLVIDIK